ncbi:MAG: hypothetical protein AAFR42_15380, partial [Cyanobacteria bacterium J06628_6]
MPSQKLHRGFACLASTLGSGLLCVAAVAQESAIDAPLPEPMTLAQRRVQVLDLALVPVEMSPSADAIATGLAITHETLSETDMTAPSLWWQQDKIGEIGPLNGSSRVVMGWAAHRRPSD